MDRICDRIAGGEHLREICADPWMPGRTTVLEWIKTETDCAGQYSRALEARADKRSDRIDGYVRRLLAGEITPEDSRRAFGRAVAGHPPSLGRHAVEGAPYSEHSAHG